MRVRSIALALGVVVLLALSLSLMSGHSVPFLSGRTAPSRGGSVTEALEGSATILNPLFAENENSRDVDALIYQGLTAIAPDQSLEPGLASSWSISPDGLVYTFQLRQGVRWADGVPFTASDVLFTFAVLQDPGYAEPAAGVWRDVTVHQGTDPNQVIFTLKAPSSSFPLLLSTSAPDSFGIIPKHLFASSNPLAVDQDPHSFAKAMGTGPFSVASIGSDGETITLKRNPDAVPQPYLDNFVFRSYPTLDDAVSAEYRGEVDTVGGLQPSQVAILGKEGTATVQNVTTSQFVAVLMNPDPTSDPTLAVNSVRQALVQAVDRRAIIAEVLPGLADVAPGPIPPTDWAYSPSLFARYGYDPVAAANTLTQAGWVASSPGQIRVKGGKPLTLTMVAADVQPYAGVADLLKTQLRAVGVELTVDKEPLSTLVSSFLFGRNYQMALTPSIDNGPDPDQYSLWHSGQGTDTFDLAHFQRQVFIDKDLEDGRATPIRPERKVAYDDFQTLVADAAPAIFLYEPHYGYAIANRVHGVRTNPTIQPVDRFEYVTQWYIPSGI